jgi:putative sterol carrier protein
MTLAIEVRKIFAKMPAAFLPHKTADLNAIFQIELTGEAGGNWTLAVTNGSLTIIEGTAQTPNLTLTMSASDYIAISRGEANPVNLFMAGKVKLQGDMGLALKFQEMFDRNNA